MTWFSDLATKISSAAKSGDGVLFRIIAFLISSFFFATYPFYLFGFYMAHHGFYAYEMLENLLSLKILFFTGFLLLALVGGFMVFSVPGVLLSYRELKVAKAEESTAAKRALMMAPAAFPVLLNLSLVLALVWVCIKNPTASIIAPVLASAALGVLFIVIAFCRGRIYFGVLSAVIVLAFLLPMSSTAGAARLFEISLQQFNLGGIYSEVKTQDGLLKGNLIFLSPTHIYLQVETEDRFSIIQRKEDVVISFIRLSKRDP